MITSSLLSLAEINKITGLKPKTSHSPQKTTTKTHNLPKVSDQVVSLDEAILKKSDGVFLNYDVVLLNYDYCTYFSRQMSLKVIKHLQQNSLLTVVSEGANCVAAASRLIEELVFVSENVDYEKKLVYGLQFIALFLSHLDAEPVDLTVTISFDSSLKMFGCSFISDSITTVLI